MSEVAAESLIVLSMGLSKNRPNRKNFHLNQDRKYRNENI